MNTRERDAYRILHTSGEQALKDAVGDQAASDLLDHWSDNGAVRITQLNPGKAPVPVAIMTADEKAAWSAHVAAHTGYVIRTFAKYTK